MPWCVHCKMEYKSGVETCADCGAPLLEQLPEPEEEPPVAEGEWVFRPNEKLLFAGNPQEADQLRALLQSEGIPVFLRASGPGAITRITGSHGMAGADVYVPADLLEEAKGIIAQTGLEGVLPEVAEYSSPEADGEDYGDPREYERKRRRRAWMILVIFVLGAAGVYLLMVLSEIFRKLFG